MGPAAALFPNVLLPKRRMGELLQTFQTGPKRQAAKKRVRRRPRFPATG